eukprot:TRINITY_DN20677_c0_g1_i1.p1 TRINITY_DN20677_c0_g1~~TRINITY_DN20677_c0_g1_i1.p1  ORF type:complete len:394 (-),score=104.24 TRINITY_DN20677_c0_g1_i1:371-1552(-)
MNCESIEEELKNLKASNDAAAKENSRLRGAVADKQYEASQLEKQIRKLERKIEALEDAQKTKKTAQPTLARGFLKQSATAQEGAAGYESPVSLKEKMSKSMPAPGTIIDSSTGKEMDKKKWAAGNMLLEGAGGCGISPEAELMYAMQNPPEVNSDFDTARYAQLVAAQQHEEAAEMIKADGGPTLNQMQQLPLEVLRKYPKLDINWCDEKYNGCSLLQWSCSMGFEEVAKELLNRGANPNHKSKSSISCLATACAWSWPSCAKLLLEYGALPEEVDETSGQTLLMWTSRVDYCDKDGKDAMNPLVELLLKQGHCDVNATDQQGRTALIHACTHGSKLIVEALLDARADANMEDQEGNTALKIAMRHCHGEVSSLLLSESQRRKKDAPLSDGAR